ncbi:MAG TPA: hypothetical protein VLH40_04085, partial [Atribacteraceae bacterium]|nr:hypothetical protein [Atribacteraceae bacterium]
MLFVFACAGAVFASADIPEIIIGWAPPDITGVFKTATDFFEASATQAREHGIPVQILTRSPATHVDFAAQIAIVEDFIERGGSVRLP